MGGWVVEIIIIFIKRKTTEVVYVRSGVAGSSCLRAKGELGALFPNICINIIILACFARVTSTNGEKLVFFWDVHLLVVGTRLVHHFKPSKLIIFKADGLILLANSARKKGPSIWHRCFRSTVKFSLFGVDPDVSASPGLAVNDCNDAVKVFMMVDGALILDARINLFGTSWYRNWLTFFNLFCRG